MSSLYGLISSYSFVNHSSDAKRFDRQWGLQKVAEDSDVDTLKLLLGAPTSSGNVTDLLSQPATCHANVAKQKQRARRLQPTRQNVVNHDEVLAAFDS